MNQVSPKVVCVPKSSPKAHPPTCSSQPVCKERLACRGPAPKAIYHCVQCRTDQCEACENLLHEVPKFVLHERERIKPPDPFLLCQETCIAENFADIHCKSCKKNYCYSCDKVVHVIGKKKTHLRVRFQYYLEHQKQEEENNYLSADGTDSSIENMMSLSSLPDVAQDVHLKVKCEDFNKTPRSYLLVDDREILQVSSATELSAKLGCDLSSPVKVVSIFGNTGDGKSHTLNYTFYNGEEVFQTSCNQASCTVGVWAAYCPELKIVTIDTEGLLGATSNRNQRTRLLLKVMAISDIVIYRTRASRLHDDLFTFLGDASRAYVQHFSPELKAVSERCKFIGPLSSLGPAVVVFHKTEHTIPLETKDGYSPVDQLKVRFQDLGKDIDAFSALEYVGTKSENGSAAFTGLYDVVQRTIENSSVRSARPVEIIFQTLKTLNEKFSGNIGKTVKSTFPDEYFTCTSICMSCGARCGQSMRHESYHTNSTICRFQHQYNNKVFHCKACYERGQEILVTPQVSATSDSQWLGIAIYAWSGYVLECPNCGVIYRSRQYWYGNKDPWETVVRTEIKHVWPGDPLLSESSQNTAQKVIDSVQMISETVSSISAKPTKYIADLITDQIAPPYWIPNSRILHCSQCRKEFEPLEPKHHCRACGNGFCENCSSKSRPVPERGWGNNPVRVCDACFNQEETEVISGGEPEVTARKVGEAITQTLGAVASAIEYPIGFIKDSARPLYWVPDAEIMDCSVCHVKFDQHIPIHHCRNCGMGVCNDCSSARRAVPSRGWTHPVRICDACNKLEEL